MFAMNTYMTFTANGENAEIALEEAAHLVEDLENLWSVTDENSELIYFALEMAKRTNGALEPTIYPVLTAWGFMTGNKRLPQAEEIAELLKNADYSRIELNGAELTVPDEMQLDLGAVAKGYTGDWFSSRRQRLAYWYSCAVGGRLCDALSTALFVMGAEEAEAYWQKNGGFDMILVTDEHEILITESIADQFVLSDGRTETIRVLEP